MKKKKQWAIKIDRAKFWEIMIDAGFVSVADLHKKSASTLWVSYNHLTNVINGREAVSLSVRKALMDIFTAKGIKKGKAETIFSQIQWDNPDQSTIFDQPK